MLNAILGTVLRNGLNGILGGARTGAGAAGAAGGAGLRGALGSTAGQAAIAVAMGMLLKGGGAGRLLKVGGMAALGTMAYKAWQEHQARQAGGAAADAGAAAATVAASAMAGQAPNENSNPAHEQAMLVAMIAAAKADGHVDDNERAQIEQALRQAGVQESDPELLKWLDAQIKSPLNAAEVAGPAQGQPELAAKLYLISVIVASGAGTGSISAAEQAWLDTLGRALQLPDEVRASLQRQAAQLA